MTTKTRRPNAIKLQQNITNITKPDNQTESWKKTLLILTPPVALSSIPKNTET